MDLPNAFISKADKPTEAELAAALGPATKAWTNLVEWMAEEHRVTTQEWKSVSAKYGWSLQLKLKKRTIVHLSPCNGCFRVGFALGDRAVKAARESHLPQAVAKAIDNAPRYAEGTGVRLIVKSAADLPAIRKLVEAKLAT